MFWADEIAQAVIARRPGRERYGVYDYKTPSGHFHAGSLRGVVIHAMIARAIEAAGHAAEFTWGYDSFDPMDGFPVYLDESFRQYMGVPLSEIPSPDPAAASNMAEYYAEEFGVVIEKLGIRPTIIYMDKLNKAGFFNETIRIALDKADIVRKVYKEISGAERGEDWFPVQVVCETCGKIGTTRVYAWDGELVSYRCEPAMVKWAVGCGHDGKISPFNGNGKMLWKVEWAAKWLNFDEDFETAGKDHMTKNGSFDVAAAIAREVYDHEAPLGRQYPYEFLLIGGKKMSSSKGLGITAKTVSEMLPPHLLTFMIGSAKPNRQMDFEPGGNTMPLLYDAYDAAIKAYLANPESEAAKVIAYTKPEEQELPEYTMRFTKVSFVSQMPNLDIWAEAEKEKGAPLTPADKIELAERIEYAKQWLRDFAPEEMKFELQSSLPNVELSEAQKTFLRSIHEFIVTTSPDGVALHEQIHTLKTALDLPAKEAFGAIYRIFLGKESGPQAGWFLAALDRDFVLKRLTEALSA